MQFTIKSGQQVNIDVGDFIKVDPAFIDDRYDDSWLEVVKIEDGYPFVKFPNWSSYKEKNGNEVFSDEVSAISPEIIEGVQ